MLNKFIIVGTQRTGSSALAECIGTHQQVSCGWEWTQRVPFWKKIQIAEKALDGNFTVLDEHNRKHMQSIFHHGITLIGFRRLFRSSNKWRVHPRHSPALWIDRLEGHVEWIKSQPSLNVIHIVREDNIDWIKSKYLAKESNMFVGNQYPEGLKVIVDIKDAVARLQSKAWVDSRLACLASTNSYLQVSLEDFVKNKEVVLARSFSFLGVPPVELCAAATRIKKQSTHSAEDYIINYQELLMKLNEASLLPYRMN